MTADTRTAITILRHAIDRLDDGDIPPPAWLILTHAIRHLTERREA